MEKDFEILEEDALELERLENETSTILSVLEGRKKLRGMDYYIPNAMQYKAHISRARTIAVCAGNRSGKSTFGCMELCYHLTRKYPDWFPKERRFKHPIRAVISATGFPVVSRVIEPKIFSLLPRDYFTVKRSSMGYIFKISCKDGSTVDILTSEMADEAYESADWDFAWEDEPQQQRKREALMRGLVDRNGIEVITFTPLSEPWMKDEIVDKADGQKIEVFSASTRDNMFDIKGNPILSEEGIKRLEDNVSEEYREARLHGVFFTMRGLVYKGFTSDHIKEFTYQYPDPVICVLDPHDRLPHHAIWAFIDRQNDILVDSELIVHCELDILADKIVKFEEAHGYRMKKRLIDPNFGRRPSAPGSNRSVMQELARYGAAFYEACDNIELGHMVVREYLKYDRQKPVTAVNKPKLFFHRLQTPATIKSVRNLQFQEWQGKTKGERDPKEVEKEKENHGADTVRYLCVGRPAFRSLADSYERGSELEAPAY